MNRMPRGYCATCAASVAIGPKGTARKHDRLHDEERHPWYGLCEGSGVALERDPRAEPRRVS